MGARIPYVQVRIRDRNLELQKYATPCVLT